MESTNKKKIFYGWFLVGAMWLMMLTTTGMLGNTMSQFLKPVCEEFGMPRAGFSMLNLIASIVAMSVYPMVGSFLNRHRSPWIIRGGALVLLCGYLGYSLATTRPALYAAAVLYGLGGTCTNMLMINIVLNNWFHARKGFVMGFVSTGSGVGSAIFNPVASSLIASHGYRVAFRALGGFAIVLMLPCLILYRFKPEDKGLTPYGLEADAAPDRQATGSGESSGDRKAAAAAAVSGMTRPEAFRNVKFYLLLFICFSLSMGVIGVWQHISPYLTDIGYSAGEAARLMSLVSIVLAISKFFFGWLNDRIGTYRNYLLFTAISVTGVFMVLQFRNPSLAVLCAVLFGIAFSETNIMCQLITVHTVGSAHFSDIYGIISMATSLGAMLASPLSGVIFDLTGTYTAAFILYGFLYLAALLIGAVIFRRGYGEPRAEAA